MTDLAALVVRMQADNSEYIKGIEQATSRLSKFSKDQDDLLKGMGEKLVEAFTVAAIVEFTKSAVEGAAGMERMSESTGIAVEALSSLRLAAAASGLDADGLGTTLKKLNVNIAEAAGAADSKAGVAFRALGISVTDTNGQVKDAGTIMGELADKFSGMADGPNKVAFAIALLGKQGQAMIPVLNEGSAGLAEFKAQAEAAGIVMSSDLAAAAEKFSQKAGVMKAILVDGLGQQLVAQLLPAFNSLIESWSSGGNAGEKLKVIAEEIATLFKIVATVVIDVVATFQRLGNAIGAVSAAAVAAAHGHFSEAHEIWKEGAADNVANQAAAAQAITDLWEAGGANSLEAITVTAKKIGEQGANLAKAMASNAADTKLEQFSKGIEAQSAAFGLGGAALVAYKLQVGDLAKELGLAGDAGKKAANDAIAYATALQTKKDDKTIADVTAKIVEQITVLNMGTLASEAYKLTTGATGEALKRLGPAGDSARAAILELTKVQIEAKNVNAIQKLDDDAQKLSGHLVDAATHAYDLQNKALKTDLESTDNTAGLAKLDVEREHIINVAKINELNLKATQINTDLAVTESKINLARTQGQISDLTAQSQESTARTEALTQLQAIYVSEQNIAAAANDPALVDGVKKFGTAINALQAQTTQFENSVRSGMESAFANNFEKLITGAESFRKAVTGMLQDIEKQFADLIAKNFAQNLFGTGGPAGGVPGAFAGLFSGSSGNTASLSNFGSFFSKMFGGGTGGGTAASPAVGVGEDATSTLSGLGFAGGGTIPAGKVGLVGEDGPELAYSGAANMNIVPMGSGKAPVNVTNHFIIQAPGGTISRQSQAQTAAAAGRSIGNANQRSGG